MGSDQALARLRSAKHAAWLVRRRAWAAVEPGLAPAIDVALGAYTRARPPRSESLLGLQTASAPRRIFCLWTGHNPMSPNRERAMEEIRRLNEPSVEVEFVTPETLDRWILAEHPLHPAYEGLSLIHRADYLRTYLMHHYGGGYTDVKAAMSSWAPAFDEINADQDVWLTGYPELSYRFVAPVPLPARRELQAHHARLLGNCAYICRPKTPFTAAWLTEAERRLDDWSSDISQSPGEVYSGPLGYPVPFYGLLGEIFHPLCLRYWRHLRQDVRLAPQVWDYK